MRILVCPHDLGYGGSQLNAVEIGWAVRELGHDVVVAGVDGPMRARIDALGLPFVELPPPRFRPSPGTVRALRRLVVDGDFDIVHGYEWPPVLHGLIAAQRTDAVAIATVMSMAVAPFIPTSVPLVVGTEQIAARALAAGREMVEVLVPPVDLRDNDPGGAYDVAGFRAWAGADADSTLVVCVGRLVRELKAEGVLGATAAAPELPPDTQLVFVGDGAVHDEVIDAAEQANSRAGRTVVLAPGALNDPRPAYAAADVVLGMGGSALRGMAFGKPVVVQGTGGYWRAVTPQSLPEFLWSGWYGIGDDAREGPARLLAELGPLLADADLRRTGGAFGRQLVVERFSLAAAARSQVDMYERMLASKRRQLDMSEALRATSSFAAHAFRRKVGRLRGGAVDDFNAAASSRG